MTHAAASRLPEPEHGEPIHAVHHKVPYYLIFFLLVGLTGATVLIAMKRFESEVVNVLLALFIASIKASLVALFFMHLKFEGRLIYVIAIVPLLLCVLLVVALIPDILKSDVMNDVAPLFLKAYGGGDVHH